MRTQHFIYYFGFLLTAVLLLNCNGGRNDKKIPDLTETYSSRDKKPFGAYVTYRQLGEMFYNNTIRHEGKGFEDKIADSDTASIYTCFSESLYTTDKDVEGLIDYAENGNDVFLAVARMDNNLMKKLEVKVAENITAAFLSGKPYKYTGIKIKTYPGSDSGYYQYFYLPFNRSFTDFNKTTTRVLGVNENGDPNYIVIFKGRGRIFLHCEPRAFSNYFLLQKNNYQYLQTVFGYLRPYPEHLYWNDFYSKLRSPNSNRRSNEEGGSSFSEILSHPPLAAAFWLALALLALYILFGIKRRQRIIEVIKPNENTTVTFTETIGRLYLQKKDNKNIADKMITYFNEYIRNNYFLNSNQVNDDFITILSRKSGVPRDKVEVLYRTINHAHANTEIDDYELMALNEQIQNFYKNRN